MDETGVCPKCHGLKRLVDAKGTIHPCWDCLLSGEMDQHSKNPKESKISV